MDGGEVELWCPALCIQFTLVPEPHIEDGTRHINDELGHLEHLLCLIIWLQECFWFDLLCDPVKVSEYDSSLREG